jgi:outer membrane protein OmpA-like peptidoglycan-associated protein
MWRFGNESSTFLSVSFENAGDLAADVASLAVRGPHEVLGGGTFKVDFDRPLRLNLWLQKGRLRVYANDDRLVDANQVQLEPIDVARLELKPQSKGEIVLARVRIAESAPDFSETIRSTGRYASHGIHFDVDSDRMQSESQPVLKMIAAGLQADPSLKVRIEGHTDATGSAEHNADLSRRRAEAVRNALASEFKIDPARLTVDGLGSKRPVESNDTPAGRAANRRVEFVRQ